MLLALLETDGPISGTNIANDSYGRDMVAVSFVRARHVCYVHVECRTTSWGRGTCARERLRSAADSLRQAEICRLKWAFVCSRSTICAAANISRGHELTCSFLEDRWHSCGRLIQRGLGAGHHVPALGRTSARGPLCTSLVATLLLHRRLCCL